MFNLCKSTFYFSFTLLFILFFSGNVSAQDDLGGIISGIEIKEKNGKKMLIISGEFTESMFANIKLTPESDAKVDEITLKVPGAVVDPEKVSEYLIQYGEDQPLEKIEIIDEVEEISEDEVIFIATFKIKSRKKITAKLIQPITTTEIKIDLGGAKAKKKEEKPVVVVKKKEEKPVVVVKKKEKKRVVVVKKKEDMNMHTIYRKPSILRLSILNASGLPKRAFKLSVFLGHLRKQMIESKLGVKFNIINISNAQSFEFQKSTIFFREHYLKPALVIANLIPGEQRIVKMVNQSDKSGVDVEIYLGKDYK